MPSVGAKRAKRESGGSVETIRRENQIVRAALHQQKLRGELLLIPPPAKNTDRAPPATPPALVSQLTERLQNNPTHDEKVTVLKLHVSRNLHSNTNPGYMTGYDASATTTSRSAYVWGRAQDLVATTHIYKPPGSGTFRSLNRRKDELSTYLEAAIKFKTISTSKSGAH